LGYRKLLFVGFLFVAVMAFECVPDFLSVRGLCALVLLGATPLLDAAYMEWAKPQRPVDGTLGLPRDLRLDLARRATVAAPDWLNWLFVVPSRARIAGGVMAAYGLVLCGVAFTIEATAAETEFWRITTMSVPSRFFHSARVTRARRPSGLGQKHAL